jgi:hypothetical protein
MSEITLISDIIGSGPEDDFLNFDLTEVQATLHELQVTEGIDLAHAESLAQKTLRCADLLAEYLAKLTKTVSYLESRVNSLKNKASLEYESPTGKTTAEMRKWAGDVSPEVEEFQVKVAKAKGSKSLVEKKFDIIIKAHHHFKDIAAGLRKTILGYREGV